MNTRLLLRYLGLLLIPVAGAMGLCAIIAVLDRAHEVGTGSIRSLTISAAVTFAAGLILTLYGGQQKKELLRKEAIALVGLTWLVAAFFGALPYLLVNDPLPPLAAYFESMSGFTTTGSTVIEDLDRWPKSIIFWRSLTQWLGGVGILVLFVALLSAFGGGGGHSLFRQESSVNATAGFETRARDKALRLWQIYLVLTAVCFAGLMLLGMDFFDAAVHTFSTVSTGGFSSYDESVSYFRTHPWIEIWITIFMVIGGLSFVLLAWLTMGRWDYWEKEEEARAYLWILGVATLIITFDLLLNGTEMGPITTLRTASFQVVSIMTSTGFGIADYNEWPTMSRMLLVLLMFIGGCAGSTAGGIKVRRFLVFLKMARQQVISAFRPNQVFALRLNGSPVSESARNQILFYIALNGLVLAIGTMVIGLLEPGLDLVSAFTSVAATLFNIGPGLSTVGPTSNFADFSPLSHLIFSIAMALGRLEFFAILVLFLPELWRKY